MAARSINQPVRTIRDGRTSWPPSVVALLIQLLAFPLAVAAYGWSFTGLGPEAAAWAAAGVQGAAAAIGSRWAGQARWWHGIHLFFPLAVLAGLRLEIAPGWYLASFVLLAGIYWSVHRSQVPLYLSSRKAVDAVGRVLPDKPGMRFLDAGCGTGGLLLELARRHPEDRFTGVEIAPLPLLVARARRLLAKRLNVEINARSMWNKDLGQYDVVYAYLSPVPMERFWLKAKSEMRPGSLFISNSFEVPGVPAHETVELHDMNGSTLHLWRM
jgi:SAM-dependent methyltransferase